MILLNLFNSPNHSDRRGKDIDSLHTSSEGNEKIYRYMDFGVRHHCIIFQRKLKKRRELKKERWDGEERDS